MIKRARIVISISVIMFSLTLVTACQEPKSTAQSVDDSRHQAIVDAFLLYATAQANSLISETEKFSDLVSAGRFDEARALYAQARMHYERIEPIAEAIGDLDPRIDAREGDVPDDEWVGYHRLEKFLWSDEAANGAAVNDKIKTINQNLVNDTKLLRAKLESVEFDITALLTGAVELLNEVSVTKITGEEERYSHTDIFDIVANFQGSQFIYNLVERQVAAKDPKLAATISQAFATLEDQLKDFQKGRGYLSFTEIPPESLKAVSRSVDALAEPLSLLPKVLLPTSL